MTRPKSYPTSVGRSTRSPIPKFVARSSVCPPFCVIQMPTVATTAFNATLTRIVFLYNRGASIDEIAAGLSFMATDIGIQTVIQITCQLIADRLNQIPVA